MMINVPSRKQSGLQKELSQTKENVPSSYGQELARKQKRINRCDPLITRGKWSNKAFEEAMDVIENGTTSLRKVNKHWNIILTSLFDHLYGKTKSRKHGPASALIVIEYQVMVAWDFSMQEVGLLINLQQLKMKVA